MFLFYFILLLELKLSKKIIPNRNWVQLLSTLLRTAGERQPVSKEKPKEEEEEGSNTAAKQSISCDRNRLLSIHIFVFFYIPNRASRATVFAVWFEQHLPYFIDWRKFNEPSNPQLSKTQHLNTKFVFIFLLSTCVQMSIFFFFFVFWPTTLSCHEASGIEKSLRDWANR